MKKEQRIVKGTHIKIEKKKNTSKNINSCIKKFLNSNFIKAKI